MAIFKGAGVAMVTPMKGSGEINYEALGALIDDQIANHTDAIIICGTTGEAPTLEDDEHLEAIRFTVDRAAGKIPVIAGTGSNNTAHAIMMSKEAQKLGADGCLLVAPYYNKATQNGLVQHFTAIAGAIDIPCILYNVPSRTGLNMLPETVKALSKHPRIAAVKEASGNISQVAKIRQLCGEDLAVYSGCDDQTVPVLSLGGAGVISVASNVLPREMSGMCRLWFGGETEKAAEMQLKLLEIMNQLMIETNPIPAKAACAAMGFGENRLRLPLVPMEEQHEQKLLELMKAAGALR